MYKLVRLNVERVVDNEHLKDKLINEGYKLVVPEELAKEKGLEDNKDLEDLTVDKLKELAKEKGLEDNKDLEDLTVDKLKELAKEKGLEGISKLNKEELIKVLKGDE